MAINYNWEVFKEPKGFMKILQIIFVVITFACICSFNGQTSYRLRNNKTINGQFKYSYPFDLQKVKVEILNNSAILDRNFTSNSQFSVFIGVLTFLYCIAAILVYVCLNDFIYRDPKIRKVDFVIEAVLAILFFVLSIAWSDVVVKMKYVLGDGFCDAINCKPSDNCSITGTTPFSTAYIGIIAGFTAFLLLLSGLWFLWKETTWFNISSQEPAAAPDRPEYAPSGESAAQGDPAYY